MKKIWLIAPLAVLAITPAAAEKTKQHATTSTSSACKSLGDDYDAASKQLAANLAEGIGDDSAIRATMRESQNQTTLDRARMTMDLMKGNGCKMPTSAPSANRYLTPALACQTDELKQSTARMTGASTDTSLPDSCDQTKWQPAY